MANDNNHCVDDMQLNTTNSLTHLLDPKKTDELNVIRHSPYTSADELIESRLSCKNGLSILSLNCQSLRAKFDYIRLLIDKFANNNCPLQVICLQETGVSSETDLSLYMIPGYHLISTGHYASTHGGLVIYLNKKWDHTIKATNTLSKHVVVNRLYKRLKQTKTDAPSYEAKRTSFNKYKNLLKKTITHAKCVFYKNLFDR